MVASPLAQTTPTETEAAPESLYRSRAFMRLWAGQSISVFGDQVTLLALPLAAVLVLGAGPAQTGILTAAGWAPHLVLSLVAGTWIDDRQHRRRIMVIADICRAVLIATIPIAYWLDALTMNQLYAVAFATGCGAVFFDQSYGSFFITIVPRRFVVLAQSRLSTSRAAAQVGGPALAGALVAALGAPVALLADGLSFLGSALFLGSIRVQEPAVERTDTAGFFTRTREGFAFIFGHPLIRAMVLCVTVLNFFNLMLSAILVVYLTRQLDLSPGVIGATFGAGALGGVLGALLTPSISKRIGTGPAVITGAILFPLATLLVPLAAGPVPVVVVCLFAALFFIGIGVMLFDVNLNSVMALVTPYRLRGRSAGAVRFFGYGCRPLGALVGGYLGATIGLRETLFISSFGTLSAVLFLWFSPFRHLREAPELVE